ncbi:MAG: hypothetical protein OIF50_15350, partial [Flavobacteriaceae bacterium]|nr:hypothetical protein [Flavobacteriaceae bacterium]
INGQPASPNQLRDLSALLTASGVNAVYNEDAGEEPPRKGKRKFHIPDLPDTDKETPQENSAPAKTGARKNDKHGRLGGKQATQKQEQLKKLQEAKQGAPKKKKKRIQRKIERIEETIAKQKNGIEHGIKERGQQR